MHYYILAIIVGAGIVVLALIIIALFKIRSKTKKQNITPIKSGNQTDKLNFIFNSIDEGVILIDQNKVINVFNPAASRITGWEAKDAIGIDIRLVARLVDTKSEPIEDELSPFNQVFTTKQRVKNNNIYVLTKNNSQIAISLEVTPISNGPNSVDGAVILLRNISEEKIEEQKLADFISTASHEMRTPVAAIEGYLALALGAKTGNLDDKTKDYLEKAHMATEHLGQLFQDLLTSAKAEDGRLTNHPKVVEISDYLKGLNEDLRFAAEKKGLRLELILSSNRVIRTEAEGDKQITPLYYVYVDPDRLREVITNLFDNAVKFTSEGSIKIGLTANEQVIQFYIKDTGVGIPEEDIGHLFQKFYRVDNSATRTIGGTGLGLFICRKIIELYNGRIWVESKLGEGSTFFINLPRISQLRATELMKKEDLKTTL